MKLSFNALTLIAFLIGALAIGNVYQFVDHRTDLRLPVCIDLQGEDADAAVRGIEDWGVRVARRATSEPCAVFVHRGEAPAYFPEASGYTRDRTEIVLIKGDARRVAQHEFGHVLGLHD